MLYRLLLVVIVFPQMVIIGDFRMMTLNNFSQLLSNGSVRWHNSTRTQKKSYRNLSLLRMPPEPVARMEKMAVARSYVCVRERKRVPLDISGSTYKNLIPLIIEPWDFT